MVSWLPHTTSCCCCLGLEAGAKLIGYLHLISSVVLVCACGALTAQLGALAGTAEDDELVYSTSHTVALCVTAASVCHVALGGALLYGAYRRRTAWLRGWVLLMVALYVVSLLYIVVTTAVSGFASSGSDIFVTFLEGLLFYSVVGYCIVCVNSYYMLVKSSEDMDGPKYNY